MASARYWRLLGPVPYGADGILSLSEFALLSDAGRVDAAATITASREPTSGTLADLKDASTGVNVVWNEVPVWIQWDLGSEQDVTKMRLNHGTDSLTSLSEFIIERSADGITWTMERKVVGLNYISATTAIEIALTYSDPLGQNVVTLVAGNGPLNATTIVDTSPVPKTYSVNGDVKISDTQSKFGGTSIKFDGSGDWIQSTSGDYDLVSGDFTVELWVYLNAYNTGGTAVLVNKDGRAEVSYPQYLIGVGDQGNLNCNLGTGNGIGSIQSLTSPAGSVPINQWVHIAMVRLGTNVRLYVNGEIALSTTQTASMASGGQPLQLGHQWGQPPNQYLNGYINGFRITKGVARYTEAFTPIVYWGQQVADQYSSSVVLLVSGLGEANTTQVFDSSPAPKTLTLAGDTKISGDQSKFGTTSLYLDGAGDYITMASSEDFNFGTGDFTIECWAYQLWRNPTYWGGLIGNFDNNTASSWGLWFTNQGHPIFIAHTFPVLATTPVALNTWHHLAVSRNSGTLRLFLNGAQVNSATLSSAVGTNLAVRIGGTNAPTPNLDCFAGYISDLRVTKGVGRYTSNFVPAQVSNTSFGGRPRPKFPLVRKGALRLPASDLPALTYTNKLMMMPVDMQDGGQGVISGTVKEKNTPFNTPLRRRVRLFEERSGRFIRETWSDADTGMYYFTGLKTTQKYTVVAYDHNGVYRGVIADNLTPETE